MIGIRVGDEIKGDKIVCEARKISNPRVIPKTGRHKAQQVVLWENAYCVIEKEQRFLPKK